MVVLFSLFSLSKLVLLYKLVLFSSAGGTGAVPYTEQSVSSAERGVPLAEQGVSSTEQAVPSAERVSLSLETAFSRASVSVIDTPAV